MGLCLPWTAFAQIRSQPNLTNPLGPPPGVNPAARINALVNYNNSLALQQYLRQQQMNQARAAIDASVQQRQEYQLQQQQYELQQLEIERQKLALQAEQQAYREQVKAQSQRDLELWKAEQQQQQRGLQSKQQHKTKKKQ